MPASTDSLPQKAFPLDLDQLRAQTAGDAALEREVLALFLTKSALDLSLIEAAGTAAARRGPAHALVGSARAIGAGAVADAAGAIERGAPAAAIAALRDALAAAQMFIRDRLKP
jgi:hypothetical protein